MALQVKIISVQASAQQLRVSFNVGVTGNYASGGDTLDFTNTVQDPAFIGLVAGIVSTSIIQLDVWDQGGNIANGVFPVLGAALNSCKVKFTSAFNTELSAGAYPGAITGSKICGEAIFSKLL